MAQAALPSRLFWLFSVRGRELKGLATAGHGCRRLASSPPRSSRVVCSDIGGSSIAFSTGKYARLAAGSALVESGDSSVLVTAVSEFKAEDSAYFLPLLVDYRERGAATNKIPQTFLRRELRPSTSEYLTSRFVDRSVRALFPSGYYYNTQVICNMLAVDGHSDHEILAVNGASAALMLSDIPWAGPVGAVRVCLMNGQFLINPSSRKQSSCDLNLVVSCTRDEIVMVEGSAREIPEPVICEAVKLAFDQAQPLIDAIDKLSQQSSKPPRTSPLFLPSEELLDRVQRQCGEDVMGVLTTPTHSKTSRDKLLFSILERAQCNDHAPQRVADSFWHLVRSSMAQLVLDRDLRCDGRGSTELRPIECEVDALKALHGTAVFRRGESQVLCTVTFDSASSAGKTDILQLLLGAQKSKSFMVHYEFPPFATNTVGSFMNHSRREAGHGALAEKALAPLIPRDFPFTIRLNSQVLDSNGSTSMATICGGSLALFDAGVPLPRPAGGVACGLIARTNPNTGAITEYKILTDLLGIEDACGNMDFKVGGTREGITSIQFDVKGIRGIPYHIFQEALEQSREARHCVLDTMDECMASPREDLKKNRPVHLDIDIPVERIGRVLGVGAHKLKTLAEDTGVSFNLVGEGRISAFAPNQDSLDEFQDKINEALTEEEHVFEEGAEIEAKVVEVRERGVMLELAPRVFTLLHISRISHNFLNHPSDAQLHVGDTLTVKYTGKDYLGRHQVSRKALLDPPEAEGSKVKFQPGQVIEATVRDVRGFGLMVDLAPGVSSLLHIKNLSHEYIRHPSELGLKPGDSVMVQYVGTDYMGRHEVSRKALLEVPQAPDVRFERGQVINATVREVQDHGLTVEISPDVTCLLHVRNLAHEFTRHPSELGLEAGDTVMVKYQGRDKAGRHVVSRKALLPPSLPIEQS